MDHFIILERWHEAKHVTVKRICRVLDPSFDSYCVEMYLDGVPQKLIDRKYVGTEREAVELAEKFINSDSHKSLLLE
jgi:hypothetical protein